MSVAKMQISAPLEAGQSLLDSKLLPSHLNTALEYISTKLVQKRLHLSLIVVRRDVQGSSSAPSPRTEPASTPSQSVATSPAKSVFSKSTIHKTLRRVSSLSSLGSPSECSSPSSPSMSTPVSPTGSTCSSSVSGCPSPTLPNPYGISLIHACALTAKAEKILRHYVHKAEKKYSIGTGWLSSHPLTSPILCSRTNDLIRRSLNQNSVVFSSEGLTLFSLDHVYTFKCQLHTYSRTLAQSDLTSAIEELQRLVLAQNGRRITKGYLMRAYDWLGVSLAALVDVNEGYKAVYGGAQRRGGIELQNEERRSPPPLKTNFHPWEIQMLDGMRENPIARRKLVLWSPESAGGTPGAVVDVGESAKGRDRDGLVRADEDRGPHYRGPATPNTWEDVTPVTRGEWLCLMVGESWREARTVPVITCFD